MPAERDALTALAPVLRVRPELRDFCRFGGAWRVAHTPEDRGWASFHIVIKGRCSVTRNGQSPISLDAGDVLLLPHGDGHVVYSRDGIQNFREIIATPSECIQIKETRGAGVDTELICGRFHLESSNQNLVLKALPRAIVLKLNGVEVCTSLAAIMRQELQSDRPGASAIASDLASALFVMLLRQYLECDPPAEGLLALLSHRETAKAAAAILKDPAKKWELDELASLAAVSRATLVRSFRKLGGKPPLTFLSEIRLALARHRIAETSDAIAQIAVDVGYQSESALSRAFLRRYALRPGAIRRAIDEGELISSRPLSRAAKG